MEVKIGVQNVAREITFESTETAEQIQQTVAAAVAAKDLITLRDDKGRVVLVPADRLGYLEIGAPEKGRVGFGSL